MPRTRTKDSGLSAEGLKKQMYQSLQSAGVLNNLKGYLRQSVINELRGRYKGNQATDDTDLFAATVKKIGDSWNRKAIDNLILHHLKESRYLYSLSLFQQESGITEYDDSLTKELFERLGASSDFLSNFENDKENKRSLPNSTSTPVNNVNDSQPLIWKILKYVSSAQNLAEKFENDLPNDTPLKPLSLADKLQAIDDEMDGTLRQRRHGDIEHRKSVATLASATRRAEEAAEKRARESFEQWKKVELATMRVTEMEKAREQVAEKTRQLEDDFSQRKEALLMREKNAIERLSNQKESLEKDLYQQRQLLITELDQIRTREKNLQEKEQLMKDMEMVKLKELDLMKSEVLSTNRNVEGHGVALHSLQRSRRESAVSSCAESLRKSLTGKESRQLDEVLQELDSRSNESEMLRRELMNLKEELVETKNQMKRMEQSEIRPSPRTRTTVSPRDENDQSLRRRLDALTTQLNEWKQQDRAEREANIETEIGRWKTEVKKLSEARERLDEKQQNLEDMTLRINARMNLSEKASTQSPRQRSSSALRVLMDPQTDSRFRSSIRDYEPVHAASHVRWADEMPYSVQPSLMGKSLRSPRYTSGNSSLDESSTSTSSQDLSTSGLRIDIQEKFRALEKESENLEQMYKRYIQSNYKHISSDIPAVRPTTRTLAKTPASLNEKSSYEIRRPKSSLVHKKSPDRMAESQELALSQGPLDINTLDNKQGGRETASSSRNLPHEVARKIEKKRDEATPISLVDSEEKSVRISGSTGIEIGQGNTTTRSPKRALSSVPDESAESSRTNENTADEQKPTPTKRHTTLPHLSLTPKKLPPIPTDTSTELLKNHSQPRITQSEPRIETKVSLEKIWSDSEEDSVKEDVKPLLKIQSQPRITQSEPPLETNFSMKKLSSDSEEESVNMEDVKPLFKRPALFERKKEELQNTPPRPVALKSPEQLLETPKSPGQMQDAKLHIDIHNDEGIENILQSIDMSSARSLEGETNPDLADLLKQLSPNPVTSKSPPRQDSMKQDVSNQIKPSPVTNPPIVADSEDSLSNKSSNNEEKLVFKDESSGQDDKNVLSEHSGDDYSDQFLSSTESKTASEIKTMSDFEPSSTSIPHIDDKQSDEDGKSEADANWSNLQLDKSGPVLEDPEKVESPRVEIQQKDEVDVFEESLSSNSIAIEEKKSQSSGDDFW